jgi:hypothetical protein
MKLKETEQGACSTGTQKKKEHSSFFLWETSLFLSFCNETDQKSKKDPTTPFSTWRQGETEAGCSERLHFTTTYRLQLFMMAV